MYLPSTLDSKYSVIFLGTSIEQKYVPASSADFLPTPMSRPVAVKGTADALPAVPSSTEPCYFTSLPLPSDGSYRGCDQRPNRAASTYMAVISAAKEYKFEASQLQHPNPAASTNMAAISAAKEYKFEASQLQLSNRAASTNMAAATSAARDYKFDASQLQHPNWRFATSNKTTAKDSSQPQHRLPATSTHLAALANKDTSQLQHPSRLLATSSKMTEAKDFKSDGSQLKQPSWQFSSHQNALKKVAAKWSGEEVVVVDDERSASQKLEVPKPLLTAGQNVKHQVSAKTW